MQNTPATQAAPTNVPAINQPSHSERFTNMVMKEFSSNAGELNLTSYQKKLIQNYFIKTDAVLKEGEKKRMQKGEQYRDITPMTWEHINMQRLAVDVIAYSSVGLDPTQPNHINIIPFKNNAAGKYDITFIIGYKGTEIKAKKYGLDTPDDVIVELVYSNDKFRQFKKDMNNKVEGYTFEVVDDFNRGEVTGGFYYHVFYDKPEKNKLKVYSKSDIEKRKPAYASAEFWGGEKQKWENGQKAGMETIDGWYEEMAYKTIYRAAYNAITIDSEKIDEHYVATIERESEMRDLKVAKEIEDNANKEPLDFSDAEVIDEVNVTASLNMPQQKQPEQPQELFNEPAQGNGPGF